MSWFPFLWKPWRKFPEVKKWNDKTVEDLLTDISALVDDKRRVNILFVGVSCSGKSSTINSYFSILENRISCRANAGSIGKSYTTTYQLIPLGGKLNQIVLYDTMGIDEHDGINLDMITKMVEGKVIPESKIHCVVYVFDAEHLQNGLKQSVKSQLYDFMRKIRNGPPTVMFLTKVDCVCPHVKKDLSWVYSSSTIKVLVEQASDIMGVPRGNIFPVKNYVDEQSTNAMVSIPLLVAMKRAVSFAKDFQRSLDENNFSKKTLDTDHVGQTSLDTVHDEQTSVIKHFHTGPVFPKRNYVEEQTTNIKVNIPLSVSLNETDVFANDFHKFQDKEATVNLFYVCPVLYV